MKGLESKSTSEFIKSEDDLKIFYEARLEAFRTELMREFEQKLGAVIREANTELGVAIAKYKQGLEGSISSINARNMTGVEKKEVAQAGREALGDKFEGIKQRARAKLFK